MKLRCLALALTLAALAAPALRGDDYALDNSHTSIIFAVKHMQFSYTYGRFNKASGTVAIDAADPTQSKFQITIDAASVDTNDAKRDGHLKGPDFFDSGQFPVITFESTKVEVLPGGDGSLWKVSGNLTLHGVTRPIEFNLKKVGEGKGMEGEPRVGFVCQTSVKRTEFGMTKWTEMVGDEVAVTISFEGAGQAAAAAAAPEAPPARPAAPQS